MGRGSRTSQSSASMRTAPLDTDARLLALARVQAGVSIAPADAQVLSGLIEPVSGPTSGSGYALTERGETVAEAVRQLTGNQLPAHHPDFIDAHRAGDERVREGISRLLRAHEGLDVKHPHMVKLMGLGLVEAVPGPSSGSGYRLTETGRALLADLGQPVPEEMPEAQLRQEMQSSADWLRRTALGDELFRREHSLAR